MGVSLTAFSLAFTTVFFEETTGALARATGRATGLGALVLAAVRGLALGDFLSVFNQPVSREELASLVYPPLEVKDLFLKFDHLRL